jgi:hypothetical protein
MLKNFPLLALDNQLRFGSESGPLALRMQPHWLWHPEPEDKPPANNPNPENSFQKLLDKKNQDGIALARELFDENHELRKRNRELKAKVPADGTVILSAEDAKAWEAYRALGKPEEIGQKLKDGDEAKTKLSGLEEEKVLSGVATELKWKPEVLSDLAKGKNLTWVVTEKDGKKTVSVKDADGKEHPAEDYAKANWSLYLPALQAEESDRQIPAGGAGKGGGTGSAATDYLNRLYTPQKTQ